MILIVIYSVFTKIIVFNNKKKKKKNRVFVRPKFPFVPVRPLIHPPRRTPPESPAGRPSNERSQKTYSENACVCEAVVPLRPLARRRSRCKTFSPFFFFFFVWKKNRACTRPSSVRSRGTAFRKRRSKLRPAKCGNVDGTEDRACDDRPNETKRNEPKRTACTRPSSVLRPFSRYRISQAKIETPTCERR